MILQLSTPYANTIPSNSPPPKFRNFTYYICFLDQVTMLFMLLTQESQLFFCFADYCWHRTRRTVLCWSWMS